MAAAFAASSFAQSVVYVTPVQPLYYGAGGGTPVLRNIAIMGSGNADFVLYCDGVENVDLYPQGSNSMVVAPTPGGGPLDAGFFMVAALSPGDVIGSGIPSSGSGDQWFEATNSQVDSAGIGGQVGIDNQIYTVGYFVGLPVAYIGFDLVKGGTNYYGWMEVQNPLPVVSGQIVQWAYATTPNTPIVAGAGLLVPVAPAQIVRPGNLRLKWQSQTGQAYQVQFKNQLDAFGWWNIGLTIIATATNTAADVPIVGASRFYRVIQVP
jgi:hypothetical protein